MKLKSVRVATRIGAAILALGLGSTHLPTANAAANPTIIVNDLGDTNVCDVTTCTLRGAVAAANLAPGDDVINFSVGGGAITLGSSLTIAEPLTISGIGYDVSLSGPSNGDWFTTGTQSLTLDSLSINLVAAGGDGLGYVGTTSALNLVNGTATLTNNTIAAGAQGGFANQGGVGGPATLNVVNGSGSLANNAITTNTFGGGVEYGGVGGPATLTVVNGAGVLTNNTITNINTKGGNVLGGGIGGGATLNVVQAGNVTLTNNTITTAATTSGGNVTLGGIGGGATLNIVKGGNGTLTNNTVITSPTNNGTVSGGGVGGNATIRVASGTAATLRNNVLQLTGAAASCGTSVTDGGGNVDSGTSCGFVSTSTSLSSTNALLSPLASNGGPTQTAALGNTSPAIGIGVAPCPSTDQRGQTRGTACDAGSYEFSDTTAPTASPTINPTPNTAGWNQTATTTTWNWTDNTNGSGLESGVCALSTPATADGVNAMTSDCNDRSGNTATATFTAKIDTTSPTVTVTGVVNGSSYASNAVPATGCATTDATSGVAVEATATSTTATDTVTITCAGGVDIAGNTQTAPVTATYTLLAPVTTTTTTTPATTTTAAPAAAAAANPVIVAVAPDATTTTASPKAPLAPTLSLSASAGTEGKTVTATADGFKADSEVTFELHSNPIVLGKVTADNNGRATLTASLPAGVAGQHDIVAIGINPAGQSVTLNAPIAIAAQTAASLPEAPPATPAPANATPQTLALTGTNIAAITCAAFAMILIGLALKRTKTKK
jgi:hypothetical protein